MEALWWCIHCGYCASNIQDPGKRWGKTGLTSRDNSAIQHLLGCVGLVVQGTEVFTGVVLFSLRPYHEWWQV